MSMNSLAETVERLKEEGYTEDFRAEEGRLVATGTGEEFAPSEFRVDDIYRFEGATDPSDMSILFVMTTRDESVKGTWSTAFGAAMGRDAAMVVRNLDGPRRNGTHGES